MRLRHGQLMFHAQDLVAGGLSGDKTPDPQSFTHPPLLPNKQAVKATKERIEGSVRGGRVAAV